MSAAARTLGSRLLRIFSSLGLSAVLLLLLGLLTWLGTLEQVHAGLFEVQKRYFESFGLIHRVGAVPIPLPGGQLVLWTLFANLLVGGMLRLRRGKATIGVLIVHVGIALMLAAGFVKLRYSEEGHTTLFEGQRASTFQSYYRWEIAVVERTVDGRLVERVAPEAMFADAVGGRTAEIRSSSLPFRLELSHFLRNARPLPKGPMFEVSVPVIDGLFLREEPLALEAEQNAAGVYATATDARGARSSGILWGADAAPWTISADGRLFAVSLRHERYDLPFELALVDFRKEDHPRTSMPSSFESDVTIREGATTRPVTISMNQPLRSDGLVVYQASWGPSNAGPGDALFSTFAVVRNPADHMPLWSCIVIACGMLLHFSRKLARHVRSEVRRA